MGLHLAGAGQAVEAPGGADDLPAGTLLPRGSVRVEGDGQPAVVTAELRDRGVAGVPTDRRAAGTEDRVADVGPGEDPAIGTVEVELDEDRLGGRGGGCVHHFIAAAACCA